MNWKRWKLGLAISLLSGLFTGVIGFGIGMTWEQLGIMLAVNVAKDGLLYLQKHPPEQISFDTERVIKNDDKSNNQ